MKKKILLLSLIACTALSAQKTYVTGTLPVKVEPKTLFYHGAGLEVKDATAVFTNDGNVQVRGGAFKVVNPTTGLANNFRNVWNENGVDANTDGVTDNKGYGQLIVEQSQSTVGKIAMDRRTPVAGVFDNVQSAFPFLDWKGNDIIVNQSDLAFGNNSNRQYHPVYAWKNSLIRWDRVLTTYDIYPTIYYILRNTGGFITYDNGANRTHIGRPNNAARSEQMPTHATIAAAGLGNNGAKNAYNERYTSYVDDPFVTDKTDLNWGKNIYQFGNPYTSNIDLSYIGYDESTTVWFDENGNGAKDTGEEIQDNNVISSLVGVFKYTGGKEVGGVTSITPNNYAYVKATATGGKFLAGDNKALLIRPFEPFLVKTNGSGSGAYSGSFNFNDGLKTFAYSAKVASALDSIDAPLDFRSGNTNTFGDKYYQVALELFDNNGTTDSKTFVVANATVTNGNGGVLEADNLTVNANTTGIYTKEEVANGVGLDPVWSDKKMYINQINTDYLGNAIPLFLNVASEDAGQTFTFKFNLFENIRNIGQSSFSNSAVKYYFHDILLNEYVEITNDFEYTFTQSSSTGDRFELFFGGMNDNLGVGDLDLVSDTTLIYNNGGENSIKFDTTWNKANISVYTTVGQLVYSAKGIDTQNDYVLPLNSSNTTTYIVKIDNVETGESISKKVVK